MSDAAWMLPPLAVCLVLTGIHGYLGIHVLSRKVIFVDLALAQIAALGSVYAILLGYDPEKAGEKIVVYLFSLAFTLIGAVVFSFARMRQERVPQEAFIGVIYAVASAVAILLLARAPGEGEHLREMLVGNVLLVTWADVARTAGLYAFVGVIHWVLRRRFFEISADPEGAAARGVRVRLWDFAFYATFGLVITSSVAIAGVLLVFSFLVVPAIVAFMFSDSTRARILIAWAVGVIVSALGIVLSYSADLPTGPSVVACFAIALISAAVIYYLRNAQDRLRAIARVVAASVVIALLGYSSRFLANAPEEHAHADEYQELAQAVASGDETAQIEAIHHLEKLKDPHTVEALVELLRTSASDRVIEHVLDVLPGLGEIAQPAAAEVQAAISRFSDPFLQYDGARALVALRSAAAFSVIAALLESSPPKIVEEKVGRLLGEATGNDFGVGSAGDEQARARARVEFLRWFQARRGSLRWRSDRARFE